MTPAPVPPAAERRVGIIAAVIFAALLAACGKSGALSAPAPAAVYGASADATTASAPAPHSGTQTLAYPDDLQMVLFAHHLAGAPAPLDDWAQKSPNVRQADEFARAAALQTERDRLAAIETAGADAGFVQLKTDGNISEYDPTRGGYYLAAFAPGTVYKFTAYNETVNLQFDNLNDAYLWPLDVVRARQLLQKMQYHTVDIDLRAAVVGAERRSNGLQLIAHLRDFRIFSRNSGAALQLDEIKLK